LRREGEQKESRTKRHRFISEGKTNGKGSRDCSSRSVKRQYIRLEKVGKQGKVGGPRVHLHGKRIRARKEGLRDRSRGYADGRVVVRGGSLHWFSSWVKKQSLGW